MELYAANLIFKLHSSFETRHSQFSIHNYKTEVLDKPHLFIITVPLHRPKLLKKYISIKVIQIDTNCSPHLSPFN